ncbi:hypothetical protein N7474_007305 [Penicillium riverlandense]|uniref:uncharacterized protein n=1 Tax=Penicillium riverlandense TaxID=1903569 RepID=UPI0025470970|nr:uncharacterized protein N7474_007305 [Penicillium riverlandense]KAJ5815528.1 hypothetical protein N7474_007305 [Penicillium riverlandense]
MSARFPEGMSRAGVLLEQKNDAIVSSYVCSIGKTEEDGARFVGVGDVNQLTTVYESDSASN